MMWITPISGVTFKLSGAQERFDLKSSHTALLQSHFLKSVTLRAQNHSVILQDSGRNKDLQSLTDHETTGLIIILFCVFLRFCCLFVLVFACLCVYFASPSGCCEHPSKKKKKSEEVKTSAALEVWKAALLSARRFSAGGLHRSHHKKVRHREWSQSVKLKGSKTQKIINQAQVYQAVFHPCLEP